MYKNIMAGVLIALTFGSFTNSVHGEEITNSKKPAWLGGKINLEETETKKEEAWQPQKGDKLIVNVKENYGQLIHPDGKTYTFPVLTGQKRIVNYIGRRYFAATPITDWEAKSMDFKDDRITFGKSGRFLRLYKQGEATPYGIHPYKYYQSKLDEGQRFVSYGCILVDEKLMDLILETWQVNDNMLEVKTVE